MTFDLWSEVKTQNSLFDIIYVKIHVFGVKEYKYGIGFSFWPLKGHLSWPLTSVQRSKQKIPDLAYFMSMYRFCQFFYFKLMEVLFHDIWSEIKPQNSLTSDRAKWKTDAIFKFLNSINICYHINHANKDFWVLRSFDYGWGHGRGHEMQP